MLGLNTEFFHFTKTFLNEVKFGEDKAFEIYMNLL